MDIIEPIHPRTVYLNGKRFVQETQRRYLPYSRVGPGHMPHMTGDYTVRRTFAYRNPPNTNEWPVIIDYSLHEI